MKKLVLTLLAGLSAIAAFAQEKGEDMNQRFYEAKMREMVYRLEITDAQKPDFEAVYKRYSDEMRSVMGSKPQKPENRPETVEDASKFVKARLCSQNKAQEVRLKYVDQFAKVLDARQLMRLYEVESQIQHKLMDRKNGKGGNGRGPGNSGPGGADRGGADHGGNGRGPGNRPGGAPQYRN